MPIYELRDHQIRPLAETTFRDQGLRERQDLQRLLQDQIHIVDPDVMVLAEEFGSWEDSKRRIDLLALDRDARLVVIELKRTERGGHMELQALRYASMVSRMTFEQAVEAHDRWLEARGRNEDAEQAILSFLGWDGPEEEDFGQDVRIVLVSGDFSKELTTSVLWLNEHDLDVRCVRMKPYESDGRVLLDVQQVIPLPEAGEYLVQVREKERKERRSRESNRDLTRYDVIVDGEVHRAQAKRQAMRLIVTALCAKGASPEQIAEQIPWKGRNLWRSAEGRLDADAFARRMESDAKAGGLAWEPRRWHRNDDALIYAGGKTWALAGGWGRGTEGGFQELLARWPDSGIELKVSKS